MKLNLEITSDGDVTLPHELLQHLGVDPGGQIEVTELPEGRIELRGPKRSGPVDDLFRYAYDQR
jgi:bifunctional DNA-binding transcriptional regulator/antitoxin component of YhaV-PrlF toxin-antitoxin module